MKAVVFFKLNQQIDVTVGPEFTAGRRSKKRKSPNVKATRQLLQNTSRYSNIRRDNNLIFWDHGGTSYF